MAFERGDIVEVYFDLPYHDKTETHPAVIISNHEVYNTDEIYICVMITSSRRKDLFTFEVTQNMLQSKNNKKVSQARCHLVTYIKENHIVGNYPRNRMKVSAVNRLIARINETALEEF